MWMQENCDEFPKVLQSTEIHVRPSSNSLSFLQIPRRYVSTPENLLECWLEEEDAPIRDRFWCNTMEKYLLHTTTASSYWRIGPWKFSTRWVITRLLEDVGRPPGDYIMRMMLALLSFCRDPRVTNSLCSMNMYFHIHFQCRPRYLTGGVHAAAKAHRTLERHHGLGLRLRKRRRHCHRPQYVLVVCTGVPARGLGCEFGLMDYAWFGRPPLTFWLEYWIK